jgi:PleD family two-component response regulator
VIAVADGQEAADRFLRERPDLAILEVELPRVPGLEVAARMRALPGPFAPILFLGTGIALETRLACLAAGEDFIARPADAQVVCARVAAHLRVRRLVEEHAAEAAAGAGRADGRAPSPGVGDRTAFVERLAEEWKRSTRTNEPLAVIVAGVDGAGAGVAGRQATSVLAAAMRRCLRELDVLARADDSHLCGLLLNVHVTGAMAVADRLRRELRRHLVDGAAPVVSMGIAVHPGRDVLEPADLLRIAERAIARARDEGPGRICIYQHQSYLYEPA